MELSGSERSEPWTEYGGTGVSEGRESVEWQSPGCGWAGPELVPHARARSAMATPRHNTMGDHGQRVHAAADPCGAGTRPMAGLVGNGGRPLHPSPRRRQVRPFEPGAVLATHDEHCGSIKRHR